MHSSRAGYARAPHPGKRSVITRQIAPNMLGYPDQVRGNLIYASAIRRFLLRQCSSIFHLANVRHAIALRTIALSAYCCMPTCWMPRFASHPSPRRKPGPSDFDAKGAGSRLSPISVRHGFANPQQDMDMTQLSVHLPRARLKIAVSLRAVIPAKAGIHLALVHA